MKITNDIPYAGQIEQGGERRPHGKWRIPSHIEILCEQIMLLCVILGIDLLAWAGLIALIRLLWGG